MSEERISVFIDTEITGAEIVSLQAACGSTGWGLGTEEMWNTCIRQALCVVGARDSDSKLVGLGFLIGNIRHAEPVDVTVDPSVQRQGIGRRIMQELLTFANDNEIQWVNLIRDPATPWLKEFYESMSFEDIDFAMAYKR